MVLFAAAGINQGITQGWAGMARALYKQGKVGILKRGMDPFRYSQCTRRVPHARIPANPVVQWRRCQWP